MRRWGALTALALAACAAAPLSSAGAQKPLHCEGVFKQGGVAICTAPPGAQISIDGHALTQTDENGYAVIGFDRDAPAKSRIEAVAANGEISAQDVEVAQRTYSLQRVDGLPQNTVTPTDPELLKRIAREVALKKQAFASRAAGEGFRDAWRWPVTGRMSGAFGDQRIDNGVPKTPHYGFDIAVPAGTQVRAPAGGVVVLAQPAMHFEGGFVMLDHGQGLISMYLHLSRLDVKEGQTLAQGDPIGAVGMTGRATGPHLCWRLKWRDRYLDPSLTVAAPT